MSDQPAKRDQASPSDHLANERTLLAWVRTAITLMALGFVVARFGLLLRELSSKAGSGGGASGPAAPYIGLLLLLAGVIVALVGIFRFLRMRTDLQRGAFRSEIGGIIVMVALVVVAGLALAGYLLVSGPSA